MNSRPALAVLARRLGVFGITLAAIVWSAGGAEARTCLGFVPEYMDLELILVPVVSNQSNDGEFGDAMAKLASSGKKWYARQDSNLRPSA